ncbi:hypothetical protein KUCAC02_025228, partial [Chaenocephalus aceratus]
EQLHSAIKTPAIFLERVCEISGEMFPTRSGSSNIAETRSERDMLPLNEHLRSSLSSVPPDDLPFKRLLHYLAWTQSTDAD